MSGYNPRFTDGQIAPTPQKGYDGFAIAALITALLLVPFAPIVLGLVARSRCRRSGKQGSGMGMAAIVLGIIAIIFWMAVFAGLAAVYGTM